ncbi:hypothetical protein [Allobaculum sp. JKK-2023]|uniref:hypothetical protein n=1 Tax=Allobaculum sp. JKK-2023 TaxID=3108943 RepID=UPI002B056170|nr:hypothetical protein [Allobaculum sp. JKK-2023]
MNYDFAPYDVSTAVNATVIENIGRFIECFSTSDAQTTFNPKSIFGILIGNIIDAALSYKKIKNERAQFEIKGKILKQYIQCVDEDSKRRCLVELKKIENSTSIELAKIVSETSVQIEQIKSVERIILTKLNRNYELAKEVLDTEFKMFESRLYSQERKFFANLNLIEKTQEELNGYISALFHNIEQGKTDLYQMELLKQLIELKWAMATNNNFNISEGILHLFMDGK